MDELLNIRRDIYRCFDYLQKAHITESAVESELSSEEVSTINACIATAVTIVSKMKELMEDM